MRTSKLKMKKMDKKTEAVFKESHVAVLLENLNENFKVLADGQDLLSKKFDRLENRMDGLENRMDGLENRMGGLENRMDGLENKVCDLERETKLGFSLVMQYLQRLDNDIAQIRQDLDHLKKKKVDWAVYDSLEKRVEINEKQIEILKAMIEKSKAG